MLNNYDVYTLSYNLIFSNKITTSSFIISTDSTPKNKNGLNL
nr:MAG TPA: hypothetical protein [Caudoviricetes sp.]